MHLSPARFASLFALLGTAPLAAQSTIYSSLPDPIPGNVSSLGYQASQTAEFGDLISTTTGPWALSGFSILMSNWAYCSAWATLCNANASGYNHDLTLSLYEVDGGGEVTGTLHEVTQSVLIPWRPEPSPAECGHLDSFGTFGQWWSAADASCYGGQAFLVDFDLSALGLVLPETFGYGLAFDTQSWGYDPIGVGGPYNSLNFGVTFDPPSVGTSNTLGYWAAGGDPVLTLYDGWTYAPAVEITGTAASTVPEPATMTLLATGLAGLAAARRKKRQG